MSAIFRCDVGDGSKNRDFKVSSAECAKWQKQQSAQGAENREGREKKEKRKRKLNKLQPVNVTALLHGAGATFSLLFRYRLSFVCSRLLV